MNKNINQQAMVNPFPGAIVKMIPQLPDPRIYSHPPQFPDSGMYSHPPQFPDPGMYSHPPQFPRHGIYKYPPQNMSGQPIKHYKIVVPPDYVQPKIYLQKKLCGFCRRNGEDKDMYESHYLRDKTYGVICPVLSKYVCPACGATGNNAHTISYCPYLRMDATTKIRAPLAIILKSQRFKSNGDTRY